jgi:hypothetical protein
VRGTVSGGRAAQPLNNLEPAHRCHQPGEVHATTIDAPTRELTSTLTPTLTPTTLLVGLTEPHRDIHVVVRLSGGSVDSVFWYTKHLHYALVWILLWN